MPCELMIPVFQVPSGAATAPPVSIEAGLPRTLPTSEIAAPGGSPEKAQVNDVPAGPAAGVQLASAVAGGAPAPVPALTSMAIDRVCPSELATSVKLPATGSLVLNGRFPSAGTVNGGGPCGGW